MEIINKLNNKVKELLSKAPLTAEQAWAQAKFDMDSIQEIEEFETKNILDKIQDSVNQRETYCFVALNPDVNYSNIKNKLENQGFEITMQENPFTYWIITWNKL